MDKHRIELALQYIAGLVDGVLDQSHDPEYIAGMRRRVKEQCDSIQTEVNKEGPNG